MIKLSKLESDVYNYLNSLRSKKEVVVNVTVLKRRIKELSKPKRKTEIDDEDVVGPGKYNPKDVFLSTKSKSPTFKIGRSCRFNYRHNQILSKNTSGSLTPNDFITKSLNFHEPVSHGFSFNRTGHKLKLVNNPNFPGVGSYSPFLAKNSRSYTFNKSKREFNWKKNPKQEKIAEFSRKFIKK